MKKMKVKIVMLLLVFIFSGLYSCTTKHQCKRHKRSQKKSRKKYNKRVENIKDYVFVEKLV